MKRQLTQQEIDTYFRQSSSRNVAPVVRYDFRRLDRLPKSHLSAVRVLHEGFVRSLVSSLSAYLRNYLSAHLVSVEQLPYSEFIEVLPTPTCMAFLSMTPFEGTATLEINPSILFPMLDLLLGGRGVLARPITREITEIEQNLLEGVFRIICQELGETWRTVAPIGFRVLSLETEPMFSKRLNGNEAVVSIATELHIGESVGMLNLAVPAVTIKMMGQKLDSRAAASIGQRGESRPSLGCGIARTLQVCAEAQIQGGQIRLSDLMRLQEGDVIDLGVPYGAPIRGVVNGTPLFEGDVVAVGRTLALELTTIARGRPRSSPAEESPATNEEEVTR
jgi:flagellar motor switch protein FliM